MFRAVRQLLLFISWPIAAYADNTPHIHMSVVDATDGRPLAGVHLLYTANAHEGTFSGHGGDRSTLFLVEAVSDSKGRVSFPPQQVAWAPFLLATNYETAMMLAFLPGYGLAIVRNCDGPPDSRTLATTWDCSDGTIKLQRATSDKEAALAIYFAQEYTWEAYHAGGACAWKRVPRMLAAIEVEVRRWKQETRWDVLMRQSSWSEGPITILVREQQPSMRMRCGSATEFFAPFLEAEESRERR